ncbi:MAG: hypothetical protein HUU01_24060 [Saprospiraceae bacterium]|nr:hypothetical protein [Saprospiraceae bacterium]
MMKSRLYVLILTWTPVLLHAQGSNLPMDAESYQLLDRLEIASGTPAPYHSSLKYYTRGDVIRYALALDSAQVQWRKGEKERLQYLFRENNEWLGAPEFAKELGDFRKNGGEAPRSQIEMSLEHPQFEFSRKPILKYFYKTPANFFEVNDKHFHFRLNPMLHFQFGRSQQIDEPILYNLRGLEARGGVDDRIFFYLNITETQARFPDYVNDRISKDRALPGAGFFKPYTSDIFGVKQGYDFLNAQGYLAFNITPHVGAQFGYGRNFIGNGYRSLLLSDFANNHLYFKLNWKVWKFHYQNIFAELAVRSSDATGDGKVVSKKYMATHHLSINLTPKLNVGLFETVIFSRNNQFEFQYLNPLILYRTIEQGLGSPDNVLIGVDAKWNFLKRFQLYGQLMMDEFVFKELFIERRGWWANKYAVQIGGKYINAFGINGLDLQAEYNIARPYIYTHRDSSASYTHYNQPLAHPLGANFKETVFLLHYQISKRWRIEGRAIHAEVGDDNSGQNWGSNLLLPHTTRVQEYGNEIGQGIPGTIDLQGVEVSYQPFHRVILEFSWLNRVKNSEDDALDKTTSYWGLGLRVNVGKVRWDF